MSSTIPYARCVQPHLLHAYENQKRMDPGAIIEKPSVPDIFQYGGKYYKNSCWYQAHSN
eukprot:Pgem_evm1s5228